MLSGPVAPYGTACDNFIVRPVGRTRPEGEENNIKGRGSVGMLLQVEGTRCTSAGSRRPMKSEPKDYMRENIRRMRHIQKACRERESDAPQPVKALWQSSKYSEVPSKVKDDLQKPAPSRPQSANTYLRAHSRSGYNPVSERPASACGSNQVRGNPDKLTIPRAASAQSVQLKRNNIDFVKANGRAARHSGMRRSPSLTALDDLKKKQEDETKTYQRGATPQYLVNRQRQWQQDEEDRIANTPDPDMPPGHKVMPEADRRDTLDKLKKSQTELHQQLACLPIRTDTVRLRTRKNEIESKLAEVEEAIKIFSRPKVFVAIHS